MNNLCKKMEETRTPALRRPASTAYSINPSPPVIKPNGEDDMIVSNIEPEELKRTT